MSLKAEMNGKNGSANNSNQWVLITRNTSDFNNITCLKVLDPHNLLYIPFVGAILYGCLLLCANTLLGFSGSFCDS